MSATYNLHELRVLGTLLTQNYMEEGHGRLKPDMFTHPSLTAIYSGMEESLRVHEGYTINSLVHSPLLKQKGITMSFLSKLENHSSPLSFIDDLAEVVGAYQEVLAAAAIAKFQGGAYSDNAYDRGQGLIHELSEIYSPKYMGLGDLVSVGDAAQKALNTSISNSENPGKYLGMSTGYPSLDLLLDGLQTGEGVYVVAARPHMGKTTFAMMMKNELDSQGPGIFFSYETNAAALSFMEAAKRVGVTMRDLKHGRLNEEQMARYQEFLEDKRQYQSFIDENSDTSFESLERKVRVAKAQFGIKWIIIDYIQIVPTEKDYGINGKRHQIGYIMSRLQSLSKKLNIAPIVLSQVGRGVYKKPDRKPDFDDLAESGQIEQAASGIVFLYRPGYYKIQTPDGFTYPANEMHLIVAKNKPGHMLGTARYMLSKENTVQDLGYFID